MKTLSVDLESFTHRELSAFDKQNKDDNHTVLAVKYLLDLFKKYNTRVTFFVLGEIFEWYPELIAEIKREGHEIGYHSHRHVVIHDKKILLEDLKLSKKFLEKYRPVGFRAPRMFLKKEYLEILSNFGFKYDSSVYGSRIENIKECRMKEIPVSLFSYFGKDLLNNFPESMSKKLLFKGIPYGSGLFLSLFGKSIQKFIDLDVKNKKDINLFIHPWQCLNYKSSSSLTFIQKILYAKKINNTLEYLLQKNTFFPLKNLL